VVFEVRLSEFVTSKFSIAVKQHVQQPSDNYLHHIRVVNLS
jgi:hypothetical protein